MAGRLQGNNPGGKHLSALPNRDERAGLTGQQLVTLFDWSEAEFLRMTEGSPIRHIGHERWLRNVAVAMGNALPAVGANWSGEHVQWALGR